MAGDGGRENPLKTQHRLYIAIPVRRCRYNPFYPVSEWIVKRLSHVVQLSDKSHPAGNHKAKPGNWTTRSKISASGARMRGGNFCEVSIAIWAVW